jgi:MutS domain V
VSGISRTGPIDLRRRALNPRSGLKPDTTFGSFIKQGPSQTVERYSPQVRRSLYEQRACTFAAAAETEAARSRRFSNVRLALTVVALAAALSLLARGAHVPWSLGGLAACITAFLVVAARHAHLEQRLAWHRALETVNRRGLARVARDWSSLPDPPSLPDLHERHAYAGDLDVVGHASLLQLIGPPNTPQGQRTLLHWLLEIESARADDIRRRQEAVQELAPLLDWRQRFVAVGMTLSSGSDQPRDRPDPTRDVHELDRFVRWAAITPPKRETAMWVARVLTILTIGFLALHVSGSIRLPLWLLTATAGWVLRWRLSDSIHSAFAGAAGESSLRTMRSLLQLVREGAFRSPLLHALGRKVHDDRSDAVRGLRALEQLVALANLHISTWIYLVVQTLTLWDIHVWDAIERWRGRHGPHIEAWLDGIGSVEALAALGGLSFDHSAWTFPTIRNDARRIDAQELGHPLLADSVRVRNDVTVGPPGTFLLITGSNMSGKSTLLRAIGLNIVLAHAGGPVCAMAFVLPLLSLRTSMRVEDSLEKGLSLFMSSLLVLKGVVEAARTATPDRLLCYLLDEVLQGTNSAERRVAVRSVMELLLECQAIGAITTHDLELATDPDFTRHADSRHFQETLTPTPTGVDMSFDYRLRPGPARSGNALRLLELLGLARGSGVSRRD